MSSPRRDPIVVERLIAAPAEVVFSAWGDAQSLSQWMCPSEGMTPASVENDFRVGGRFRIVMHGEEGDYEQEGEYLEIDAPKRLVFTWETTWAPEDEVANTKVTVSLEPAGADKTHLRLVHEEITTFYDNHEHGWTRIVELLDGAVAAGER